MYEMCYSFVSVTSRPTQATPQQQQTTRQQRSLASVQTTEVKTEQRHGSRAYLLYLALIYFTCFSQLPPTILHPAIRRRCDT